MGLLTNPVIVSVGVLYVLCLKKINVLLALLVAALTAGICAGVPIKTVMDTFIRGMGNNAETSERSPPPWCTRDFPPHLRRE